MQTLILSTAIVLTVRHDLHSALRVLDSVNAQVEALLAGAHMQHGVLGVIPAIALIQPAAAQAFFFNTTSTTSGMDISSAVFSEGVLVEGRYSRLNVTILWNPAGSSAGEGGPAPLQQAAAAITDLLSHLSSSTPLDSSSTSSTNNPRKKKGRGSDMNGQTVQGPLDWVLLLNDELKPLEYWLYNLVATALSPTSQSLSSNSGNASSTSSRLSSMVMSGGSQGGQLPLAVKSLTLTAGGMVKSAGLRHYLTVIGDGQVLPAPFMVQRYFLYFIFNTYIACKAIQYSLKHLSIFLS